MANPFKIVARWYWSIKIAYFVYRNPWVRWLAIDETGFLYAFECEPERYAYGCWIWQGKKWEIIGHTSILLTGKPACEPLYHDARQAK